MTSSATNMKKYRKFIFIEKVVVFREQYAPKSNKFKKTKKNRKLFSLQ